MRRWAVIALAAVAAVVGCVAVLPESDPNRPEAIRASAEDNLRRALKDGDSARLERTFVSSVGDGKFVYCGEVNAKNSFGGYTGFQRFVATANADGFVLVDGGAAERELGLPGAFDATWQRFCTSSVRTF